MTIDTEYTTKIKNLEINFQSLFGLKESIFDLPRVEDLHAKGKKNADFNLKSSLDYFKEIEKIVEETLPKEYRTCPKPKFRFGGSVDVVIRDGSHTWVHKEDGHDDVPLVTVHIDEEQEYNSEEKAIEDATSNLITSGIFETNIYKI